MELKDIINALFPRYKGTERRKENPDDYQSLDLRGLRMNIYAIIVSGAILAASYTYLVLTREPVYTPAQYNKTAK